MYNFRVKYPDGAVTRKISYEEAKGLAGCFGGTILYCSKKANWWQLLLAKLGLLN